MLAQAAAPSRTQPPGRPTVSACQLRRHASKRLYHSGSTVSAHGRLHNGAMGQCRGLQGRVRGECRAAVALTRHGGHCVSTRVHICGEAASRSGAARAEATGPAHGGAWGHGCGWGWLGIWVNTRRSLNRALLLNRRQQAVQILTRCQRAVRMCTCTQQSSAGGQCNSHLPEPPAQTVVDGNKLGWERARVVRAAHGTTPLTRGPSCGEVAQGAQTVAAACMPRARPHA